MTAWGDRPSVFAVKSRMSVKSSVRSRAAAPAPSPAGSWPACWSVELYRQYVEKIVTELGRRFGSDPRVWGWQIDNELSHYGKDYCYCDSCQAKFRAWLKTKYGTVQNLNRDWGNAFWSQMYQTFDQIRLPNKEELVAQLNEHALLDSQRWFAGEAADYLRFQTGILRRSDGSLSLGGLLRHGENPGGIAVEVADGGVELGDGDFHGGHSKGLLRGPARPRRIPGCGHWPWRPAGRGRQVPGHPRRFRGRPAEPHRRKRSGG